PQISLKRDPTQHEDGANPSEQPQSRFEVWLAIPRLGGQRLVFWRRTPQRSRDVAVPQLETVIPGNGSELVREAGLVKAAVEKVPRAVACKHPSRAVAAVSGRRKAQDKQFRVG